MKNTKKRKELRPKGLAPRKESEDIKMTKIYKSTEHKYVCELWGASTKHPDSIFYFDEFKKSDIFEDETQVFQWLLECASKLTWPMHAKDLTEQALRD